MTKTKNMCRGCRDDYYNQAERSGCWCFEKAEVVTRTKVGYWQPPPYRWEPQVTLSCHRPEGYAWIEQNDVRIQKDQP
jgi:hypothetical protein